MCIVVISNVISILMCIVVVIVIMIKSPKIVIECIVVIIMIGCLKYQLPHKDENSREYLLLLLSLVRVNTSCYYFHY